MLALLLWCASVALDAAGKQDSEKTAAVIFLHGLGDDGDGWRSNFKATLAGTSKLEHVAWHFPKAPKAPVTLNGGMVARSWYDVYGLEPSSTQDTKGFGTAVERVEKSIQALLSRNPLLRRDRIIIGGFSQGAVISLSTLLRSTERLAGIIALSGYLPEDDVLQSRLDEATVGFSRRDVPVLGCHGTKDKLVRFKWGKAGFKKMKEAGMNIQWKTYPIAHESSHEEISDVIDFIEKVVPASPPQADEL